MPTTPLDRALRAYWDRRQRVEVAIQHGYNQRRISHGQMPITPQQQDAYLAATIRHLNANRTFLSTFNLMRSVWPEWRQSKGDIVRPAMSAAGAYDNKMTVPAVVFQCEKSIESLEAERVITNSQPLTFVNSEVMDLIKIACSTMGNDTIYSSDIMAPTGFLYFEKPILVNDYHPITGMLSDEITFPIVALSWRTENIGLTTSGENVGPGLIITCYADIAATRTHTISGWEKVKQQYPNFSVPNLPDDIPDNLLYECEQHAWAFGAPWSTNPDLGISEWQQSGRNVSVPTTIAILRKTFLALMRFSWQELIVPRQPTAAELTRQTRRKFERSTKGNCDINVLYLRRLRHDTDAGGADGRSLTYQFLVRGHWRNQWYPSLGPATEHGSHRQIWIDPHVKGPAGAPFLAKQKVTALVR